MTREQLLEIAKPILFNTPMVQAIQDGRKTQTRRVIKPQPVDERTNTVFAKWFDGSARFSDDNHIAPCDRKPRHQPGDILYVRETWQYFEGASGHGYAYKAGGGVHNDLEVWRPSIHMPKAATRIFLRVTDVRAERLKDITLDGIEREGLYCDPPYTKEHYAYGPGMSIHWIKLWDNLNAMRGFGWDTNPWVWVYSFERVYTE